MIKEVKDEIIAKNRVHETDTGSPEVQIAILTERIKILPNTLKFTRRTIIPQRTLHDGRSEKKHA